MLGMRSSGLSDPYLKLNWAKHHLDALDEELEAFHRSEPCRFTREDNLKDGRHYLRVKLMDIPDNIALMCGDAFYCMRSCLDQLVWRLAKIHKIVPERVQFPVIEQWDADGEKLFKRHLRNVPGGAVSIIRSLQPANAVDSMKSHHLWRLNAMCNLDKHRRIPVRGCVVDFNLPTADPHLVKTETSDDGGAISVPIACKEQLDLDPNVSFQVVFGDDTAGVALGPSDIRDVYEFVSNQVLPRFMRFFP